MESLPRILIGFGLGLIALGAVVWVWQKLGAPRVPGDWVIERPGVKIYFPLGSSLLISAALSLLFWLLSRR